MLIGYARVSSTDQNVDLQVDALTKAGAERIITDQVSGATTTRAGLDRLLDVARRGDIILVWRLDRLGRSLPHLLETLARLENEGIGFRSLQESLDTTSAGGRLVLHVFAALAQFERDLLRERTLAGLASARARGRKGGRPVKLDDRQKTMVISLYESRQQPVREICRQFRISKVTLYNYLAEAKRAKEIQRSSLVTNFASSA